MKVFGFGEKKTPRPFISSCDKFIYLEILSKKIDIDKDKQDNISKEKKVFKRKSHSANPNPFLKADRELVDMITDSIEDIADENGWAFLGDLGNFLLKKQPNFDPRNYGYVKLVPLIKSFGMFEIDEREVGKGKIKHVYVRTK
jgi:hypothetical protein